MYSSQKKYLEIIKISRVLAVPLMLREASDVISSFLLRMMKLMLISREQGNFHTLLFGKYNDLKYSIV